jgi:hypothetical protein
VAERFLEITRDEAGTYLAEFADDRPPVPVATWADVRRIRSRHRLIDHWTGDARETFIAGHGHPYDDWWAGLSADCQRALIAEPRGAVPPAYAVALKRSLRDESGRDGLRVEGSFFTAEVRAYIAARSARDGEAAQL